MLHHKYFPLFIVIVFGMGYLLTYYGHVLFNPNAYMFGDSGDGIKNYYTLVYHATHDLEATEFEGMNYPYGENFLYIDGHPALSQVFDLLGLSLDIQIGVLNAIMLLAIALSFVVVYILLKKVGLKPWFAVLFACCIGVLAPQVFRMTGHYSMSYSFAIPLALYLLIELYETRRFFLMLILFTGFNIMWLFTHAYLGVIILFFIGTYTGIHLLLKSQREKRKRSTWVFFIGMVLPLLFFRLFASLTDQHPDRTDNPMGFFDYHSSPREVYVPPMGPLKDFYQSIKGDMIPINFEGVGYLGFWSTVITLVFLVFVVGRFVKFRKWDFTFFGRNKLLWIFFLASIPVLLFSFALPFKWYPPMLEKFSILKQFRGVGRFVWIYYFVFGLCAAWLGQRIHLHFAQKGYGRMVVGLLLVLFVFTIYEADEYHSHVNDRITKMPNHFSSEHADVRYNEAVDILSQEDFQAILPMPFYHYGSENFHRPRQGQIVQHSMILSARAGLPLFGAYLTRSSIQESKSLVQLMSPDFYKKSIEEDWRDDRDILVLCSNEERTVYEENILIDAEEISTNDWFSMYRLRPEKLFDGGDKRILDSVPMDSLKQESWVHSDSSAFFFHEAFETEKTSMAFRSEGAHQYEKKGNQLWYVLPDSLFSLGQDYALSVWMKNDEKDQLNQWFGLRVFERDEEGVELETVVFPEMSEVICENWSLVELNFKKRTAGADVQVMTFGRKSSTANIVLDDLMLYSSGSWHARLSDDGKFVRYNNHWIPLD